MAVARKIIPQAIHGARSFAKESTGESKSRSNVKTPRANRATRGKLTNLVIVTQNPSRAIALKGKELSTLA